MATVKTIGLISPRDAYHEDSKILRGQEVVVLREWEPGNIETGWTAAHVYFKEPPPERFRWVTMTHPLPFYQVRFLP